MGALRAHNVGHERAARDSEVPGRDARRSGDCERDCRSGEAVGGQGVESRRHESCDV